MSLLAGFDIVIEISRAKLVEYIRTSTLAGQPLTAPTEILQGTSSTGVDLILLQDVDLTFSPGDANWATIVVPFEDSTITVTGQKLGPVKGTLFVHGLFDLVTVPGTDPNTRPFVQQIAFFPRAVTHAFDESIAYSAQALAALPNRASFEHDMDRLLGLALSGQNLPAKPKWFIDDSQNGTIGGRFCSLTVAPISDQVLGLFGILLPRHLQGGNPAQKSGPVLAQGESLAVSLGPDAFHDLVFCPQQAGAQAALANQPAQLAQYVNQTVPPDCGSADRQLMSDPRLAQRGCGRANS